LQESKATTKEEKITSTTVEEKPKSENQNLYLLNKEKARNRAKSKKLEAKIQEIENNIATLNKQLESPEVCCDYIKVMEIQEKIDVASIQLEKLMEEWISLN
jgi:hypothetical protein